MYDPSTAKPEDFRDKHIFLATPMFGGMCFDGYHNSVCLLERLCALAGIRLTRYINSGDALVHRARNSLVQFFLNETDAEVFVFVDADIAFEPGHFLAMCGYVLDKPAILGETNYRIVGAPYPTKIVAWEKLTAVIKNGGTLEEAKQVMCDFVFTPDFGNADASKEIDILQPIEVKNVGTGFVAVHRSVFEELVEKDAVPWYQSDVRRKETGAQLYGDKIYAFFNTEIVEDDPGGNRILLSEDYYFNHICHKNGIKTYYAIWPQLTHIGRFNYKGSVAQQLTKAVPTNVPLTQEANG